MDSLWRSPPAAPLLFSHRPHKQRNPWREWRSRQRPGTSGPSPCLTVHAGPWVRRTCTHTRYTPQTHAQSCTYTPHLLTTHSAHRHTSQTHAHSHTCTLYAPECMHACTYHTHSKHIHRCTHTDTCHTETPVIHTATDTHHTQLPHMQTTHRRTDPHGHMRVALCPAFATELQGSLDWDPSGLWGTSLGSPLRLSD